MVAVTWDGESPTVSKIEKLAEIDNKEGCLDNRINDGKADPAGRLWACEFSELFVIINNQFHIK